CRRAARTVSAMPELLAQLMPASARGWVRDLLVDQLSENRLALSGWMVGAGVDADHRAAADVGGGGLEARVRVGHLASVECAVGIDAFGADVGLLYRRADGVIEIGRLGVEELLVAS